MSTTVDLVFSLDNFLYQALNNNFDTNTQIYIGEQTGSANTIARAVMIPDFSPIPAGQIITAATLKMTPINDASNFSRTMYAHRIIRTVVAGQSKWLEYSTGNSWGADGCSDSATDYDGAVVIGSATQPAAPTLNSALSFQMALDATEIQKFYDGTYTNNGIILFVDTQYNDAIFYASTQHATAAYRPVITVTYEASGSPPSNTTNFFAMF